MERGIIMIIQSETGELINLALVTAVTFRESTKNDLWVITAETDHKEYTIITVNSVEEAVDVMDLITQFFGGQIVKIPAEMFR